MKAWTLVYNAFVMGSNVWQPKGFEFEDAAERVELGKGFFGYVLQSPAGKTIIVEERSGAIVGNSLDTVRNDIAGSKGKVMEDQVVDACKVQVQIIGEEEFWKVYDKSNNNRG